VGYVITGDVKSGFITKENVDLYDLKKVISSYSVIYSVEKKVRTAVCPNCGDPVEEMVIPKLLVKLNDELIELSSEMGSYKDMEIELKIKSVSGKQDQGGGFIWRAKDADNYYVARWNPLEDNFRVYYVKNGKRQQIASAKIKADPNKWHEMEIKHFGTTIIAEFDDKELLKIEDKTFTKAGKVGLWTKADAATKFDDFVIKLEADDD